MARSLAKDAIPTGWKYDLLDKFATRCSGHTPSKSFPEYWDGGVKWISLADSFRLDQGYVYETDKEISEAGIANSSAELHPAETVVLSRDAGIGKSGVMAVPMAVSQHFIAWKCDNSEKLNSWFLYNWLQLNKAEFERQAVGSTIKTIGLPYFKKLKIAVPPYTEQQKIAQILSTWDKAIITTEQLLANSQQQKKALMQQLLTGKKRLLDENGVRFTGEWQFKSISQISKRIQRKSDGEDHPILTISSLSGFVRQDERYSRYMAGESVKNYILLKKGEFAYNKGNSKTYEFGCIFDLDSYKSGLVPHVYVCFKLHQGLSHRYFKYLFEADYLKPQLGALVNTGVRNNGLLNIKPSEFMNTKVPVPSFDEQEQIADVLHASSETINKLQLKLDALKQEKKALMQQLLTGKRRVLVS
ncbi:MAG TPA: restriction endonuclease subunit S [Alteromonas australica]|uniref:Restriction endonuclease subunit S n=1 Tax=Alteromonas australica TaxID=589873 RepID=A0A350NYU2_9ALTE|nr:restriction endonuclease subunit S [Alteromonas australica]MBU34235.1 type I restriction endonuclease subunit R [Alteromonas sp.]HAW74209.1 restriction endonuclease subunit S [Alteromonas australica]HBU49683.1 restriction endonuclease subunit S [Alteromonas australica]|tara:strand:- start:18640 stop:19884 length:1245 start_codon:yes stop_codon:yes gene_type:complete